MFDCESYFYADDLKIFSTIINVADCVQLQHNINKLLHWCDNKQLIFQSIVMSYHSLRNPIDYTYKIKDVKLIRCFRKKDPGITFDSKLSFNQHVTQITSSLLNTMGFIMISTKSFNKTSAIILLYSAFVHSKHEYWPIV